MSFRLTKTVCYILTYCSGDLSKSFSWTSIVKELLAYMNGTSSSHCRHFHQLNFAQHAALLFLTCVTLHNLQKGWLPIAKLKPLVERYSCQPMRSLDTSNNLSVGPSCMWRTWNSWLCYLVSNAAGRRAGWEEQRDREKQGERGRAGEEQWKGGGKLLNLVIQVTGVE